MSRLHTPGQTLLVRLGTTVVVVGCLALLLLAASGAVAGQEVDISLQPEDGEVAPDGQITFEVVVEGADDGIGAHDIEILLDDGAVAEITDVSFVKDPIPVGAEAAVRDGGTRAVGVAAMGDNSYSGGDEVAVLEVTVRGKALDATELTVAEGSAVGPSDGGQYMVGSFGSALVGVVEDPGNDGSGPGFGVLGALAALAGAGYLRYRADRE